MARRRADPDPHQLTLRFDDPMPAAQPVPGAPVALRHPQADHELVLDGRLVGYALKRARRRSIGFIVGEGGLSVNAPPWVSLHDIETALVAKAGWILRKLHEQQQRTQRTQAARIDWRDGTSVPFLGETVIVVLDPRVTGFAQAASAGPGHGPEGRPEAGAGAGPGSGPPAAGLEERSRRPARGRASPVAAVLHGHAAGVPGVPRSTLHIGLPHTATPQQIRSAVQHWLQRQARRVFDERCAVFAQRLGVRCIGLALSSAQTRWGSASADGSIRLSWRLIHFPLATIDYVVAHELAHLREMNHGPRFWAAVRSVLPDYEAARRALKSGTVPVLD